MSDVREMFARTYRERSGEVRDVFGFPVLIPSLNYLYPTRSGGTR